MTLKEELELIRGVPIEAFTVKPEDVPCIETSDTEKLCKNPVVSVSMITYNHESCIRQAIEGVMMQKTDFEFELIIGEDCSQDKTREICFEYQKKYPDKIRVLWWHENVSKLGGNARRVAARCRGEFIAFCEGDDYWIDPFKLQKQVDVMRMYPDVSFCFGDQAVYNQTSGKLQHPRQAHAHFNPGIINSSQYILSKVNAQTCTVLMRTLTWRKVVDKYEIFNWRLAIGDAQLWMALALNGQGYFIDEELATYRVHAGGISHGRGGATTRDGCLSTLYFAKKHDIFPLDLIVAAYDAITRNEMLTIAALERIADRKLKFARFYKSTILEKRLGVSVFDKFFILLGYRFFVFYYKIKLKLR